jgi:hypothetical protein
MTNPDYPYTKRLAQEFKRALDRAGFKCKLSKCHEAVAAAFGFRTRAAMLAYTADQPSDDAWNFDAGVTRFMTIEDQFIEHAVIVAALREAVEGTPR